MFLTSVVLFTAVAHLLNKFKNATPVLHKSLLLKNHMVIRHVTMTCRISNIQIKMLFPYWFYKTFLGILNMWCYHVTIMPIQNNSTPKCLPSSVTCQDHIWFCIYYKNGSMRQEICCIRWIIMNPQQLCAVQDPIASFSLQRSKILAPGSFAAHILCEFLYLTRYEVAKSHWSTDNLVSSWLIERSFKHESDGMNCSRACGW